MKPLLLWDIDGTLLHNPQSGYLAEYHQAISSVLGEGDWAQPDKMDGSTDYAIIHSILQNSGLSRQEADAVFLQALVALEEMTCDSDYIASSRRPIRGAGETLEGLSSFAVQTYATGNSPRRAQAKAGHFSLHRWLDPEVGGFGFWTPHRHEFVARAISSAERKYKEDFLPVVIGDTPSDIASARSVGALSVALAGGIFSFSDLEREKPDLLLRDLSEDTLYLWLESL